MKGLHHTRIDNNFGDEIATMTKISKSKNWRKKIIIVGWTECIYMKSKYLFFAERVCVNTYASRARKDTLIRAATRGGDHFSSILHGR